MVLRILYPKCMKRSHVEVMSVYPSEWLILEMICLVSVNMPTPYVAGLVSLRTLDLSHNLLEKLDNKTHGLLDDCLSLERVTRGTLLCRSLL